MRDTELGSMGINIRAFGSYDFKVIDAPKFLFEIVGTEGTFTTDDINGKLKALIIKQFSDGIGESKIPFLDLAANYEELSSIIKNKLLLDFDHYGVEITDFTVENMSLPEHIEKMLDKRNEMEVMGRNMQGNLDNYTQFQMGKSMEEAAKKGGSGSDAVNMGIGFAMANQFTKQNQQTTTSGMTPPPPPVMMQFHVYSNGQQLGAYTMDTLKHMIQQQKLTKETMVWKQGMSEWAKASQIPELNSLFANTPPPPPSVT